MCLGMRSHSGVQWLMPNAVVGKSVIRCPDCPWCQAYLLIDLSGPSVTLVVDVCDWTAMLCLDIKHYLLGGLNIGIAYAWYSWQDGKRVMGYSCWRWYEFDESKNLSVWLKVAELFSYVRIWARLGGAVFLTIRIQSQSQSDRVFLQPGYLRNHEEDVLGNEYQFHRSSQTLVAEEGGKVDLRCRSPVLSFRMWGSNRKGRL